MGQPEMGALGGSVRGINLFVDGRLFEQQDLHLPQGGNLDMNTISPSRASTVRFLPAGLANLWGRGTGILGVDIITKDFKREAPYSRATASRGPYGFHRTQVELGRGLSSRGRFYFAAEFEESDGHQANSDCDGISLFGKTNFRLSEQADLGLSAYQYRTKTGVPFPAGAALSDFRKAVNNWGANINLLLLQNQNSVSSLNLRFEKQNQEVKSQSHGFEIKKIEQKISLSAGQTLKLKDRHQVKIEGYAQRKEMEMLVGEEAVLDGFVSATDIVRAHPQLSLLLFSRVGKEETLPTDFSACAGFSYDLATYVKIFSTLGRFTGYPTLVDRHWQPFSLSLEDTVSDYVEGGNPDLKMQKSLTADLGVSAQKESWRVSAYLFKSNIDDLIIWSDVDTTVAYGHLKPINTEAEIWGANVNLRLKFLNHLCSYLSYSFKRGQDSNRNLALPYSPKHSFFGWIQFENELLRREIGLKLRLEAKALSQRFMDGYEQDEEPGVATFDCKLTIRFLDFHFHYVVRNITDQNYRHTSSYSVPGRNFWWGFYWEFLD
jgi:outer membrane cobalamin receptor